MLSQCMLAIRAFLRKGTCRRIRLNRLEAVLVITSKARRYREIGFKEHLRGHNLLIQDIQVVLHLHSQVATTTLTLQKIFTNLPQHLINRVPDPILNMTGDQALTILTGQQCRATQASQLLSTMKVLKQD